MHLTTTALSNGRDGRIRMTICQRAAYAVGSTSVICVLYRVAQSCRMADHLFDHLIGYALEVRSPNERYLYPVGRNQLRAYALFGVIVGQAVAPCTLGDVLEDLGYVL